MEPTEIPLKRKYVVGQTAGRNKGGHNDSMRRRAKKLKKGKTEVSTAIMIMLPNGKIRMEKNAVQ